ncbi:hypothetical protein [Streptomyces auratus]|uniref:DNA primase n=1 Tax=Streptomyces auratus AGR0001 TaxID=1160718 RepID=J1SDB4_9ACTN|nr:hypothetical protein [Streptomyces auratus]QTZ95205.1 hypothetical protein SU9_030255 [Streptomyces auratus AGR0001]
MMSNAKIGVALVGGYVLGRTKKAKLAISLGMYLAGKRLPLDPKQLGKLVANSPVLGPLNDQVRSELVDATKSAVSTALTQRMSALTDSLHERTLELSDAENESRTSRDSETADEPDEPDEPADQADTASAKTSAKTSTKASTKTAAKTAKPADRATSTATGKAAHGTGKTASGARKTATGARKKASGTARRTADRGSRND